MSRSTPTIESVPVVQISLVPGPSETPSIPPAQPPPSLRSVSRSIKPPLPISPLPSELKTSHLRSLTSTLTAPTTPESQEPLFDSPKKKVLKDQPATNALVARSLMKMIKPQNTQSPTFSTAQPTPPKLTSETNQATQSTLIDPSATSQETQASSSPPTPRRVLRAPPPGGQTASVSKVGIVRFVKPIYPAVAKEAGWEGVVVVRVLVKTNGSAGEVTVQKSSGYAILDTAAMEAVEQWRFKPAKDGNILINKFVDIPLKFELHSKQSRG